MQDLPSGFRPAQGLQQLTWAQVEALDARIRSLCAFTEATGDEVYLVIVIRNGKPIQIGHPLKLERFWPTREMAVGGPAERRGRRRGRSGQ